MIPPRLIPLLLLAHLSLIASAEVVLRGKGLLLDHSLELNKKKSDALEQTAPDPAGDDLVLFNNGDLMHGTFGGLEEGLLWARKDIARPIKFAIPSIKQIVFQSSRRIKLSEKTSFITLTNGDRIPGKIVSLDDQNISLKGDTIGEITIPRNLISSVTPNPFNGELHYIGPYTSDGWCILGSNESEEKQETPEKEEKPSAWIHSGTSFYSQGNSPLILADANLPDVGRVCFNIAWQGRLSIALALHSDLTRIIPPEKEDEPEEEEEEEKANDVEQAEAPDPAPIKPALLLRENLRDLRKGAAFQNIPWISSDRQNHADIFGSGYTLSLQSGYPSLTRNYFTETGTPRQDRLNTTRGNSSLGDNGEAEIEIRFDRKKSIIMLYVNGVYSNQWHDLSGYPGNGSALGFLNRSSNAKVRISEVTISSWGGSIDSARSMEHHDRDIAVITNGTDRFSGQLSKISEGIAHFKTGYTDLQIPLPDLSLITLKKETRLDLTAEENNERFQWKSDPITVVYQPYGLIKLIPLSATATTLTGHSPYLGDITIDLKSAFLLRFSDDSPDLSDWFDDF